MGAKDKEEALLATKLKFESDLKQYTNEKEEIIKKTEAEISELKLKNKTLIESELLLKQNLISSQNHANELERQAAENAKKEEISNKLATEKQALTQALSDKQAEYMQHINKIKDELNLKIENSELRCDNLNKSLISEKERAQKMEFQHEEIILSLQKEIEQLS